jgi:hypothetical protein
MEILAKEENLTYADTRKIYNTWGWQMSTQMI